MITITRVKQATSQFIKVLRFGTSDIVTANQCAPAGIDSKPIQNKVAIYATTSNKSEAVIIGYINDSDKTDEGEIRIFSVDANGNEKTYIYLKKDGIIEFAGNTDNLVRYLPLNTAVTSLNLELGKIAAVLNSIVPGSYTPVTIDISAAKIIEFKSI